MATDPDDSAFGQSNGDSRRRRRREHQHDAGEEHMGIGRLEAFTDGVVAIAITLLVLDLHVPRLDTINSSDELLHALRHEWPSFVGFVLSFVTIGVIWANHHAMFRHIRYANHWLLMLNLLFLFSVSLLPFSTALLAEYLPHSGAERRIATVIYAGTFMLMSISFNLLWRYGTHHDGLRDPSSSSASVAAITRSYTAGFILYAIAFVLAWLVPLAGLAMMGGLALLYALPGSGKAR